MAEIRKTTEEKTGAGENGGRWVLTGTVAHGKALGRTVGMPTANLAADPGTALPPAGVYAAIMTLPQGRFMGLTNIGTRPTVDREDRTTIETYLFDFDRDIYGERARLELCFFIREIQNSTVWRRCGPRSDGMRPSPGRGWERSIRMKNRHAEKRACFCALLEPTGGVFPKNAPLGLPVRKDGGQQGVKVPGVVGDQEVAQLMGGHGPDAGKRGGQKPPVQGHDAPGIEAGAPPGLHGADLQFRHGDPQGRKGRVDIRQGGGENLPGKILKGVLHQPGPAGGIFGILHGDAEQGTLHPSGVPGIGEDLQREKAAKIGILFPGTILPGPGGQPGLLLDPGLGGADHGCLGQNESIDPGKGDPGGGGDGHGAVPADPQVQILDPFPGESVENGAIPGKNFTLRHGQSMEKGVPVSGARGACFS